MLAVCGCRSRKEVDVQNFKLLRVLTLVDNAVYPNHAEVYVNGEIEGTLELTVSSALGNVNPETHIILKGRVDTMIRGGDWYKDTIFIKLNPIAETKGSLKFQYSIWSF